jgi:hypothetical protein
MYIGSWFKKYEKIKQNDLSHLSQSTNNFNKQYIYMIMDQWLGKHEDLKPAMYTVNKTWFTKYIGSWFI